MGGTSPTRPEQFVGDGPRDERAGGTRAMCAARRSACSSPRASACQGASRSSVGCNAASCRAPSSSCMGQQCDRRAGDERAR